MYKLICLVVIIANLFSCVYLRDEHRSMVHGLCRNLSEPELGPKGGFGDDALLFFKDTQKLGPPGRGALWGGKDGRSAFRSESTRNK